MTCNPHDPGESHRPDLTRFDVEASNCIQIAPRMRPRPPAPQRWMRLIRAAARASEPSRGTRNEAVVVVVEEAKVLPNIHKH